MGLIMSWLGGVGDAAAWAGKQTILENAQKERDEANFYRQRSLQRENQTFQAGMQAQNQGFQMAQAGEESRRRRDELRSTQDFTAGENQKNRASSERIANIRSKADSASSKQTALYKEYLKQMDAIDQDEAEGMLDSTVAAERRRLVDERFAKVLPDLFTDVSAELGGKPGGDKTAQGYYDYLKQNNPNKSDAEIRARVQSKFPEFGGKSSKETGLLEPGNIDIHNRPVVKNGDKISTVRSISINEDGKEILIPTVSDEGKLLSDKEAIDLYHRTGKHLGKFDSVANANAYAEKLHQQQDKEYSGRSGLVSSAMKPKTEGKPYTPPPADLKPSPYDTKNAKGGIIFNNMKDVAGDVAEKATETLTPLGSKGDKLSAVRDLIQKGDSVALRQMNQGELLALAEKLTPEERQTLIRMLGIRIK